MPCLVLRGLQDLPSSAIYAVLWETKLVFCLVGFLFCFLGFFEDFWWGFGFVCFWGIFRWFSFLIFFYYYSPKLAMFFVTEQSEKGAFQEKACTMSSYKAGKGSCCLVLIPGIPVTNVDDLNTDLGSWMNLFTKTLILCSTCIRTFFTSLCSFFTVCV